MSVQKALPHDSRASRTGRRTAMAGAALVGTALLAACGSGASGTSSSSSSSGGASSGGSGGGAVKIGLITKTETNPFFVKMKEGATAEAKAKGASLTTAAGKVDGDNASQVTAIENMVSAGVKGILITPNDTKAIVPAIAKARAKGVLVIALDTPTEPESAVDALFATNNFQAGVLIGQYAKAAMGGKAAKIATLDLEPGISVGILRHNGFLSGFEAAQASKDTPNIVNAPSVVCSNDTNGNQAKGQTAMENCLQKASDINLVYTINEPAAAGAYTALKAAGKDKNVMIVSVDGGCDGVKAVAAGQIVATSQQYPLKMASQGVDAVVAFAAKDGTKASGYTDTGVNLITAQPLSGVTSRDVAFGQQNCWG